MEYNARQVNAFIAEYPTDERLQNDASVTVAVLTRRPALISYTSKELLSDRRVALAVVKNDGRSLRFFSDELRGDEEVVYTAVKNFRSSYSFALSPARDSLKIALAVAEVGGETVSSLAPKFLDDETVAKVAVGRNPKSIVYFSRRIQSLPSIAISALKQDRTVANFLPDEAFLDDGVFYAAIRFSDGKIGSGVLSAETSLAVYEKLAQKSIRFNFSLQNIDLLALDGQKLKYVFELGLGVSGKKAELFHKFVDGDDRQTVDMLVKANVPSAKTVLTELDYASKNKKLRVLPILISRAREIRKNEGDGESDERRNLMRNLRRKSPSALKKFIDAVDVYAADGEVVRLAASVDGSVIKVLYKTNFADDARLIDECLRSYVVKNSEDPLLKDLKGVLLCDEQYALACKRDGRNYYFLPERLKADENIKKIAFENGAERYGEGK